MGVFTPPPLPPPVPRTQGETGSHVERTTNRFFFAVLSGDRILHVTVHQHRLTIILSFCLKTEGISLLFLTGMYPGLWCTWGHRMILSGDYSLEFGEKLNSEGESCIYSTTPRQKAPYNSLSITVFLLILQVPAEMV